MNYRIITIILLSFLLFGCETTQKVKKKKQLNIENRYKNSGFALVYNNDLENIYINYFNI